MNSELSDDHVLLILIGALGAPAILAALAAKIPDVSQFMVDWQILVPAADQPPLALPSGPGLDGARLVVVGAGLVVILTWAVYLVAHRRSRARERKGNR